MTFMAFRLVKKGNKEYEPVLGACYALCMVYNVRFMKRIEMSEAAWNKFLVIFGSTIPFLDQDLVNEVLWVGYNKF